MLKGLWALITSGLIFNPMLLLGAAIGIAGYIFLDNEQLKILYTNYHLYLLFLLVSAVFIYFFRPTLTEDLRKTDWKETSKDIIKQTILMSFSFIMGMLFASFFDFSDIKDTPNKSDYQYSQYSEITSLQKQTEEMQKKCG